MLQVLHHIAVAVGHAHKIEEVIETAANEIRAELALEMTALYLRDASTGMLTSHPLEGLVLIFPAELANVRPGESSLLDKLVVARSPVVWPVEDLTNPDIRVDLEAKGYRSVVGVPLLVKGQILGAALLGHRTSESIPDRERHTLGAIGSVIGVALENARLVENLVANHDRLRALAAGMQLAREDEARRIARNLHDIGGQLLTSIHLSLEELTDALPQRAQNQLEVVRNQLEQAQEQLRHLSHELRSPILDDLGLEPALDFLVQGFAKRTGLKITVDCSTGPRLLPETETVIYRSVQEALTNVAKHARATRVWITLRRDDEQVHCTVRDDGDGFDASTVRVRKRGGGIGLLSIEERVAEMDGKLTITSAPGQGTALSITVPAQSMDRVSDARDRHHLA